MKVILSTVCAVLLVGQGFCQISNGSFESNTGLPSMLGGWSLVTDWGNSSSSSSTPDYFHSSANVVADLPETPTAIVNPYDGDAIMGLALATKIGTNKREYISTQFTSPLVVGQEYHLSFRMTNGERTSSSLAGLGVNHLGVLLSSTPINQSGTDPIIAAPQFTIDTVFYSRKWEMIVYSFVADQAYQHLTFGLFNDDSNHIIRQVEGTDAQVAYYFVDDFNISTDPPPQDPVVVTPTPVYTDPPNAPFFVPNAFTPDGDGDNDIFIPVAGFIKDWHLEVFTKWGDPVFFSKSSQKGWDGSCMGNPCANGSYIWKITFQIPDKEGEQRTVIEYGFVNLVK